VGLGHDPIDRLPDGRDVVDQAGHHAARPRAGVHLAVLHDARVDPGDLAEDVVEREAGAEAALLVEQAIDRGVS